MKISVPALAIASKDNAGDSSVGAFEEIPMAHRKLKITEAEFSPKTYPARNITSVFFDIPHTSY
jgi:hypothetical protein